MLVTTVIKLRSKGTMMEEHRLIAPVKLNELKNLKPHQKVHDKEDF